MKRLIVCFDWTWNTADQEHDVKVPSSNARGYLHRSVRVSWVWGCVHSYTFVLWSK